MKRISSFRLFLLGCLLVSQLGACKKSQEVSTTDRPSLLQYIAADSQLSLLRTAMARCDLDTVFSSGGPYTFFCPVDSAFTAAGLTADSIGRYNPKSLSNLLKYHILSGKFSSEDIVGFLSENVTSLDSAQNPFVSKNYYGIFLNGIGVVQGDIELGDGVIQKIQKVAFPATQTLLQTIDSLPELSYFAAVVNRIYNFQNLLSSYQLKIPNSNPSLGVAGVTVLVPTNAAFQASTLYPTLDAINQADVTKLASVMQAYFLNGFKFTTDFLGGYVPGYGNAEFNFPGSYEIAKDGITIIPNYPPGVSPVINKPNLLCTDGVLHEVSEFFISD